MPDVALANSMTDIQAVSVGYALDVGLPRWGVVHSVFTRAANVDMRGEMWTILAENVLDLPFSVRLATADLKALGLQRGDRADVKAGFIGLGSRQGGVIIDCRAVPRWTPRHRGKPEPGLTDRLLAVEAAARNHAWCGSPEMAAAIKTAVNDPDRLGNVLASVVGRGPGLTPAGDDVLVGILAVLSSPSGPAAIAVDRLAGSIPPLLPTTTYISGQLLRQAMNGLFARAVDELLLALIADPPPHRLNDAIQRVIETGATSGADTCMGVIAFAPSFLVPQCQRSAA